jgi:tetratricopeptide (TPR) repeat protein
MRPLLRLLLLAGLFGLAFYLFRQTKLAFAAPEWDLTRLVMLFGALVTVGLVGAVVLAASIVPLMGEAFANAVYAPNERSDTPEHAAALAAIARGHYARAVAEYRKAWEENPEDTFAVSEMARVYCDRLHDAASAAASLEEALAEELQPHDAAFLTLRLAEVAWKYERNRHRARELLSSIIASFPRTPHAATASRRLHEMEEQAMLGG